MISHMKKGAMWRNRWRILFMIVVESIFDCLSMELFGALSSKQIQTLMEI